MTHNTQTTAGLFSAMANGIQEVYTLEAVGMYTRRGDICKRQKERGCNAMMWQERTVNRCKPRRAIDDRIPW
jgi:hypothetical protein